jgi:hypothetical protein
MAEKKERKPRSKKIKTKNEPIVTETEPIVTETEPIVTETEPIVTETEPIVTETEPILMETEPILMETVQDKSYEGIIDSNWKNLVLFMQNLKIAYKTDGENPKNFRIINGKYVSVQDAKQLIQKSFGNLVQWKM